MVASGWIGEAGCGMLKGVKASFEQGPWDVFAPLWAVHGVCSKNGSLVTSGLVRICRRKVSWHGLCVTGTACGVIGRGVSIINLREVHERACHRLHVDTGTQLAKQRPLHISLRPYKSSLPSRSSLWLTDCSNTKVHSASINLLM